MLKIQNFRISICSEKHSKEECTERNNLVNLQYERFFNLRGDFVCTVHYFRCMIHSVTVQNIESTVQDVETKGNPVSLTAFSY